MELTLEKVNGGLNLPNYHTTGWMLCKVWKCSSCGRIQVFAEPVYVPTSCNRCDGIIFEKR